MNLPARRACAGLALAAALGGGGGAAMAAAVPQAAPAAEVPETPAQLNERAVGLLEEKRFDEAIVLFQRALRDGGDHPVIARNHAVAYANRGIDHLEQGRLSRAIDDLETAHRLQRDDVRIQVDLAHAYLRKRDFLRAEGLLLDARTRSPGEPKVHELLGHLYYMRDELGAAIASLERRLELSDHANSRELLERARREHAVSADFVDRSSNHFTLKFLGADPGARAIADRVLALLEEARARVGADLGHFPDERTTVLLYGREDFRKATGAHAWVGGLYDGKIRLTVDSFEREKDELARVARHEFAHRILADLAPGCPSFVDEGLAGWFEVEGDGAHDAVKARMTAGATVPRFSAMPSRFLDETDVERLRLYYAASRSFAVFLRERFGLGAVRSFLLDLGRDRTIDEAMRRSFGGTLDEIDELWRREALR